MTCDRCGQPLTVGEWPYCPHGQKGAFSNIPDDIPGGMRFYNGFEEPEGRVFYSHSEHRRALKERGCQIAAKWAGPNDKHLINWAAGIDPQTLANAAALVSRGPVRVDKAERFRPDPDVTVTRRALE